MQNEDFPWGALILAGIAVGGAISIYYLTKRQHKDKIVEQSATIETVEG